MSLGDFSIEVALTALELSPIEVLVFDLDSATVVAANENALVNRGRDLQSVLGRGLADLFCPASVERIDAALGDRHAPRRFLGRRHGADGEWRDISLGLRMLESARPKLMIVALDVSSRLSAERDAETARNLLMASIEALPHGFVLYDADDRLVICNERYRAYYPLSAHAMTEGTPFRDILQAGLDNGEYLDAIGREDDWLAERFTKHISADETVVQRLAGGRILQILEQPTPEGGRVGLRIDITDHVSNLKRAETAEQRLLDAIRALPAGFWLFDEEDRLVLINDRFKQMYSTCDYGIEIGQTFETIIRKGMENGQYPDATGREEDWLAELMTQRRGDGYELEYQLADGRWVRSLNERTSEGGLVGFRLDITEAKQKQAELERAARTDSLTGLVNRRAVSQWLEHTRARLRRSEAVQFLHIDLDKFKPINDVFGHAFGDHVLQSVARSLEDLVGDGDLVARVGGDEFLVIRIVPAEAAQCERFAKRMLETLSTPMWMNGQVSHVGASVGLSSWQLDDARDPVEAMQDADIALNAAKHSGRHMVQSFVPSMRTRSVSDATIAEDVARGLDAGEFTAHFQPILTIGTDEISGFECLARWRHPDKGILAPGDFLPACQNAGLLTKLERVVLGEAMGFAARLRAMGLSSLRISLNLSSGQLKRPGLVDQYLWAMKAAGVAPTQFRIEILESTLLEDRASHVEENIRRFSREGFLVDLDDFGTGHTAIASLRRYPIDRIKLDRSLITEIDRYPDLETLTEAVVMLGRRLGLHVLAEGVETAAEMAVVRRLGCTCAQGFHLARPLAAADCIAWLEHRRAAPRLVPGGG
jgi:diguanylate cyclase (GGDEF)-like protein